VGELKNGVATFATRIYFSAMWLGCLRALLGGLVGGLVGRLRISLACPWSLCADYPSIPQRSIS
jgi:hypothetical protein